MSRPPAIVLMASTALLARVNSGSELAKDDCICHLMAAGGWAGVGAGAGFGAGAGVGAGAGAGVGAGAGFGAGAGVGAGVGAGLGAQPMATSKATSTIDISKARIRLLFIISSSQ